jgi:hypothetical protein
MIGLNNFFKSKIYTIQGLSGPLISNFKGFSRPNSLFKGFSRLTSNSRAFQVSV